MKKKTKNKLKKLFKKTAKGLAVFLFVSIPKGIWKGSKWLFVRSKGAVEKVRNRSIEKKKEIQVERKRPKIDANYDALMEVRSLEGEFTNFEKKLLEKQSTIGIILGARGTGKSALGMRLLENWKCKGRPVCAMGFKAGNLPNWISVVDDVGKIVNGSVVLIDEGGITFSSRSSMSNANKLLSELLLVSRHKDLSVLFITQNSSNLEINVIRQADYLLLKPSSLLQKDFERKKIKEIYGDVSEHFSELNDEVGLTYVYGGSYRGFVKNSLPGFWNESVSKGFK